MSDDPGPTPPAERIVGLDALRGFALLGILVINIRVFSMPQVVLLNPTAFGEFTGANYWAWLFGHVFVEQKFITLFTLLFGGGVVLFTRSVRRRGRSPIELHLRRFGWLIAFGLGHAYLLWYGDILVAYGVCALGVVFVRNDSPRALTLYGVLLLTFPSVAEVLTAVPMESGAFASTWRPTEAALQAEIDTYRSGWLDQMDHRVPTAVERQTAGFLRLTAWRVSGAMLLGMALVKWGVLTNERSPRFYRRLTALGAVGGLAPILAGVWYIEANDWAAGAALFWRQFNYWGSFLLAGAYIGAVMTYCRWRPAGVVTRSLAAVGRTAFSNYLLQTVLATSIFYGHGLGLFGQLSRIEALGVVVVIWSIQIPASVLWLRYYRFGPIEWLWRWLTYGSRPPFRVSRSTR